MFNLSYKNWRRESENFDDAYSKKSQVPIFKDYVKKDLNLRLEIVFEIIGSLKGKTVLDLGCGVGRYSHLIAEAGGNAIGIDISETAIQKAKIKAEEFGTTDRCKFICDDFLKMKNFPKADIVIAMGFVQYFENEVDVVKKIVNSSDKFIFDLSRFYHWINPMRKVYRTLLKGIKFRSHTNSEVNVLLSKASSSPEFKYKINKNNPTIYIIHNL